MLPQKVLCFLFGGFSRASFFFAFFCLSFRFVSCAFFCAVCLLGCALCACCGCFLCLASSFFSGFFSLVSGGLFLFSCCCSVFFRSCCLVASCFVLLFRFCFRCRASSRFLVVCFRSCLGAVFSCACLSLSCALCACLVSVGGSSAFLF